MSLLAAQWPARRGSFATSCLPFSEKKHYTSRFLSKGTGVDFFLRLSSTSAEWSSFSIIVWIASTLRYRSHRCIQTWAGGVAPSLGPFAQFIPYIYNEVWHWWWNKSTLSCCKTASVNSNRYTPIYGRECIQGLD